MAFPNLINNWFPGRFVYKRLFYGMLIWLVVGFIFFTMHSNVKISQRNLQQSNGNYYEYIDPGSAAAAFYYNSAQINNGQQQHMNAVRGLMQKDYNSGLLNNKRDQLDAYGPLSNSLESQPIIESFDPVKLDDLHKLSYNLNSLNNAHRASVNSNNNNLRTGTATGSTYSWINTDLKGGNSAHFPAKIFYQLTPKIGNLNSLNEQQLLNHLAELIGKNNVNNNKESVNLDRQQQIDSDVLTPYMNHNHNLPVAEWPKAKQSRSKQKAAAANSKKCSITYPDLYELHFNNVFWQVLRGLAPASPSTQNQTAQSKQTQQQLNQQMNQQSKLTAEQTKVKQDKNQLFPIYYYLYNAYYDDRPLGGPLPQVRILAMIDRIEPPKVNCLLWYSNLSQPVITTATYTYAWYPKWGNFFDGQLQPFIVSCTVPKIKTTFGSLKAPDSVSLTLDLCTKLMNNLRVINERPKEKKKFAVCVKGLDFLHEDLSVRLVEWIELLNILGAEKIFLYDLEVHPNISKVIKYYVKKGFVELTKLTLPGEQPNLPGFRHLYLKNKLTNKRQNELIPYNDCLYRNLHSYKYLALLDIDEVIMPLKYENWADLMDEVEQISFKTRNQTKASYNVRNAYFLDDLTKLGSEGKASSNRESIEAGVPSYMHMLSHVVRSRNYTKPGQYVKCFHNTERVVSLHNHFPLNCFGTCTSYSINTTLAHLQHYRKDCVGPLHNACNKDFRAHTVRDTTIWRYKEPLINRVTQTLYNLGFF